MQQIKIWMYFIKYFLYIPFRMWSGATVERSTTVQKDLGLIPTQNGIFWKLSISLLSDNGLQSLFL